MKIVTRFVATRWNGDDDGLEGPDRVHIEGVIAGHHTLCGHVDRTDMEFEQTAAKPTCRTCLLVWNFVKNGRL